MERVYFVFAAVAGIYLVYAGFVFLTQRSILFPAPRLQGALESERLPSGAERVLIDIGGEKTQAWLFVPSQPVTHPAPAMLFAHGNGELIHDWIDLQREIAGRGIALMLVEYPGYGYSGGAPSEASIRQAMVAAYDALVAREHIDPSKIFAYGRSLGGGAVMALSRERDLAGIVLQSTFASVRHFARKFLVPGILVRDPFDNLDAARSYQGPLRIYHGSKDAMIPFEHAKKLQKAARRADLVPLNCGHNDCPPDWPAYWQEVAGFVKGQPTKSAHPVVAR